MRKMKKTLALVAIVAMVLTMVPLQVFAAVDSTRLSGADRIATAIAIADAFGSADTVILAAADQENLVDALAVAPLAGKVSPIYLTFKGSLDAAVKAKITGKKVYVIGAVSDAVFNEVKAVAPTSEKLAGADRWLTNDAINAKLTSPAGTFVVGYNAIPDALSVASYAAANNYKIVLADDAGNVAASKLTGTVYTVGGSSLVKDVTGATRLSGDNRWATNTAVVGGLTYSYDKVYVANGLTLVDALSASSLAAKANAAILLTDNSSVNAASAVNAKLTASSQVIALGGTGVVSETVKGSVVYTAPPELRVSSVNAINAISFDLKYNMPVNESTAENLGNYSIDGVALTARGFVAGDAELQDDKMTVKIVMSNDLNVTANKLVSGTAYLFQVQNVQDTNLETLKDTYSQALVFEDKTAPTLGAVSYPSNSSAKVSFSEPMAVINVTDVKVYDADSKDVTAVNLGLTAATKIGKTAVTIDLTGATKDKTYTVKIFGAQDISGNLAGTKTFTVVKSDADTTKPTVSSIVAKDLDTIEVTLSEKVMDAAGVYGTISIDGAAASNIAAAVAPVATVTLDVDTEDKLTINLNAPLAAGVHTVKINGITDKSGNVQTDAVTKALDFQADTTAPAFVSAQVASIAGVDNLLIKFDDSNIQLNAANNATVLSGTRVVDSIEYAVAAFGTAALYDPDGNGKTDTITVPLTGASNGDYTVTLKASVVADKAGATAALSNNTAAKKFTFSYNVATGTSKPKVVDADNDKTNGISSFVAQAAATPNQIQIQFDREVTAASALNVANYLVDGAAIFTSAVFIGDAKTVKLTMAQDAIQVSVTYPLTIKNVIGTNGQVMDSATFNQAFVANVAPSIKSASVVTATTISVEFKQAMTVASITDNNDFELYISGVKYAGSITGVASVNATTYTVTIDQALTASDLTKDIQLKVKDGADAKDATAITNKIVGNVFVTVSK